LLKATPEEKRSAFYGVKRDCGREKHDGGMIGEHSPNYLTLESVSELETHVVADCFGAAVTICVFGKESMRLAIILAVLLIVAVFPWALAVYGATILAYYLWYVISGLFATGFLIFAYWYSHKTSERINRRRARQAKQENN